jgi:hypothetical protein
LDASVALAAAEPKSDVPLGLNAGDPDPIKTPEHPEPTSVDAGLNEVAAGNIKKVKPTIRDNRNQGSKMAPLTVRVRPWANVFLDGKALGESPVIERAVSVGVHKLRLVNPKSGQEISVSITVPSIGLTFSKNLNE